MNISGYSQTLVDVMLGWLKGLANWVLRLFNLAGSGGSPLLWLSENWLKLLIILLIVGVSLDILVWLVRWRPHWVWFRKQRIIVNDRFIAEDSLDDGASWARTDRLRQNWQEHDYLVASNTASRRHPGGQEGRSDGRGTMGRGKKPVYHAGRFGGKPAKRGAKPMDLRDPRRRRTAAAASKKETGQSTIEQNLFGVDTNQPNVSDFYEDEVFNVSNLPPSSDYADDGFSETESAARKGRNGWD